ncbi:cell growth regulator with RING finger domain protein 1 [Heterocephalus glaber]|uniref:Cell growth regulator with RING finger domain protein 1 n=1 Tax=Heterocephalus glaber TaxID=10181 RepID=A0AAX6TLM1_HETGA|nr:cell growth regulator with RING finger domain protein 1 [Heterocephalus glaber]
MTEARVAAVRRSENSKWKCIAAPGFSAMPEANIGQGVNLSEHVDFLGHCSTLTPPCRSIPESQSHPKRFGWDVPVILRNSEETQFSTRVFKKQMRQAKNPFGLEITNPSTATITTGITLTTDCLEDSHLTCYWGCSVQKLYEALQKHAYCFRISTPQALEDALYSEYLHQEQYFIKKDSKEEIYCQLPRDTKIEDFGTVPRSRYLLVALLTLADEDDRAIYDIISMVSVIHIPDKTYKFPCRILYQYLLLAQDQFHDLKQLFMSANNNSTPSSGPSPEEKNADRSFLERAGLCEGEAELSEDSSKDCVVCQNGSVNWVLLPCRHTCLCHGCVPYFQQCPTCRQFVRESFALCSQKEQDKDKLKTL